MHVRIEWHRSLPQPPNGHLQKNTVFMIISIQAQYKLKNDIVWGQLSLPCTTRTILLWCQIVNYDRLNAKQSSKNEPVWAM